MRIRYPICVVSVFVVIALMFVAHNLMAVGSEISRPIIRTDELSDPIFGITYRPSEIRFQSAPSEVYKCRDLQIRRGDLFLFGEVTKGNIHFYFVYGWIEVQLDDSSEGIRHFEAESDSGIIVVVSPEGCRDIGAGYAWSPEKGDRQEAEKYGVTEDITSALLADAVDREVRAFGGKAEFLRRLAATGVDESKLPVQVRTKLAVLRDTKTD